MSESVIFLLHWNSQLCTLCTAHINLHKYKDKWITRIIDFSIEIYLHIKKKNSDMVSCLKVSPVHYVLLYFTFCKYVNSFFLWNASFLLHNSTFQPFPQLLSSFPTLALTNIVFYTCTLPISILSYSLHACFLPCLHLHLEILFTTLALSSIL